MDQDELEQELWRLRAVEYDLELAKAAKALLELQVDEQQTLIDDYQARIPVLQKENKP